jgi:hypothetical protein
MLMGVRDFWKGKEMRIPVSTKTDVLMGNYPTDNWAYKIKAKTKGERFSLVKTFVLCQDFHEFGLTWLRSQG